MRLKHLVPRPLRRALRTFAAELPVRLRDAPADVRDGLFVARDRQLPPARLRYHVAGISDRRTFVSFGRQIAQDIVRAGAPFRPDAPVLDVLDFGAGCGRVARHVATLLDGARLTGVDVDARSIRWCSQHLSGRFLAIEPASPLPFADASFDLIYAVSVFTHLDLGAQRFWLAELSRILRPAGCLVITTLSPALAYSRPDMSAAERQELERSGFVYLPGHGNFNENTSFQSREFLSSAEPSLALVHHATHALAGYQDIAVFQKSAESNRL